MPKHPRKEKLHLLSTSFDARPGSVVLSLSIKNRNAPVGFLPSEAFSALLLLFGLSLNPEILCYLNQPFPSSEVVPHSVYSLNVVS